MVSVMPGLTFLGVINDTVAVQIHRLSAKSGVILGVITAIVSVHIHRASALSLSHVGVITVQFIHTGFLLSLVPHLGVIIDIGTVQIHKVLLCPCHT